MSRIRGKNTQPELALRSALRAAGILGYRLHVQSLPGKPDIAWSRWKVAVFVDGVFWHGHPEHWDPEKASDYWRQKIARNRERDSRVDAELAALGWTVLRFWDVDIKKDLPSCVSAVSSALEARGRVPRDSVDQRPITVPSE